MADRDDYDVGYGKPPAAHQFQPGTSGNPRGKPKGARGLKAELIAELDEKVAVTVNGKQKRIRKLRLIIKALAGKAATGNVSAADKLLSLVIQAQGFEDHRPGRKDLSDTDLQILELMLGDEDGQGDAAPFEEAEPDSVDENHDVDDDQNNADEETSDDR